MYDCIIIGAGPAGLLLAKELSKKHSVLVLEKNKLGTTNKSWLTYEDRWKEFPKKLISNKFKVWNFPIKFIKDCYFYAKDNFICIKEEEFLNYLINICKKQNVQFKKEEFKNYQYKHKNIIINNKHETKLLIDCSGTGSKIRTNNKLVDFEINLNCYGAILEFDKTIKNDNKYISYESRDKDNFEMIGITKTKPRELFFLYFKYSMDKLDLTFYKNKFNKYRKELGIKGRIKQNKIFTYSTGELKTRSLNNIFLFGDAGLYAPGYAGMGFNEILRQYKYIARHLSNNISNNQLSKKELDIPEEITNQISNLFLKIFSLVYFAIDPKEIKPIADYLKKNPKLFHDIMRNEISDKDVKLLIKKVFKYISIEDIIKKISKKSLVYIIKDLIKLDEDILTEEIHNLIFKHHKIKIKDIYS